MGKIFKALKKSQHRFENGHNAVDSIHNETLSESENAIESTHKNCNLMIETGLKLLSNEVEQSRPSKNFLFPEEYQKRIQ